MQRWVGVEGPFVANFYYRVRSDVCVRVSLCKLSLVDLALAAYEVYVFFKSKCFSLKRQSFDSYH